MGLQAITHHTSPYSDDYVNEMGNIGLEKEFKTKKRGLGNRRRSARDLANTMLGKLQALLLEAESLGIENPGGFPQHKLEALIRKAKRDGTEPK